MMRTALPSEVSRAVRQRCGFGCVICGLPIYEYDHLLGWANTKRHVADEITLLCALHHSEKTKGLLADSTVARANAEPYNIAKGISAPYGLNFEGSKSIQMKLGSTTLTHTDRLAPFIVDDLAPVFFSLDDEGVQLFLELRSRTNRIILQVLSNELTYAADTWDITFEGQVLTVREGKRQVALRMRFKVPNAIEIERADLRLNGASLRITPRLITLSEPSLRVQIRDSIFDETPALIAVGHCPRWPALMHYEIDRYPVGQGPVPQSTV